MQNAELGQRTEAEVMPQIGETRRANEIGKRGRGIYLWSACIDCGKERWVALRKEKPKNLRCNVCAGKVKGKRWKTERRREQHPSWKGGRVKTSAGYIRVKLEPSDFFYSMANKLGYVLEHRLVVAKALGRCLLTWELVHHKGTKYPLGSIENKQDNRFENLELIKGKGRHNTLIEREISILQHRVTLLEAEIVLLRSENLLVLKEK